jgi:hypothetical protein
MGVTMLKQSTLIFTERFPMTSLNGKWIYRSFRSNAGTPSVVPWAPPGELSVTTDATGRIDGKLHFPAVPGLELIISGSITPAVPGKLPEGVELTGEGGHSSINKLQGYFIVGAAEPLIIGTIVAVRNDPGRQPDGTSGPFVLFSLPAGPDDQLAD